MELQTHLQTFLLTIQLKLGESFAASFIFSPPKVADSCCQDRMKPEQITALVRLERFLSERKREKGVVSRASINEGSIGMFRSNLAARQIPSESTWHWNQAKSKKETFLRGHIPAKVVLTKLIPRRRYPSSTKLPRYKLWHFAVKPNEGESYTVLWCEKGTAPPLSTQHSPHALALPFTDRPQLMKAQLSYICN